MKFYLIAFTFLAKSGEEKVIVCGFAPVFKSLLALTVFKRFFDSLGLLRTKRPRLLVSGKSDFKKLCLSEKHILLLPDLF